MRKLFKILLFVFPAFFQGAFAQGVAPERGLPVVETLPLSEINIPLKVDLKPFYALAEKQVDTIFTSPNYPNDWLQADCATRYKYYFRRTPLRLNASGTTLDLSFTGLYKITGSTRMCMGGAAVSPWTPSCHCGFSEGDRKVNIGFASTFRLRPDYILNTQITRAEPKALNQCTVCFWGQDITSTVLEGLKKELDASKKVMEATLGSVNLKPYLQTAWNKLAETYTIPNIGYLSLNPKQLHMDDLNAKSDFLHINIGISATPVISLIKPEGSPVPIPNLTGAPNKDGFNIHLEAALQYDSLSGVLNGYLAGKRFELSEGIFKKHVVVQQAEVRGDYSGNLLIRIDFDGSHKGTVYFTGKPVYNAENHSIEVEGLDYDLETRSLLLKTAKWLFNKRIVSEIRKYTSFPVANYYDTATKTLNTWINKEWTKGIRGAGVVEDLKLTGVYALPEHLLVRSNCVGKLSIQISQIDLKF